MEVEINEENVKRMKRNFKNKKRKERIRIIVIISIVVVLILFLAIISKIIINKNDSNLTEKEFAIISESLTGKWTTDGNTFYEFKEDGKGALIVPLSTFPFSYKIEENKISIDFENEESDDTTFEYSIDDNKLVLKNINGVFEFSRVENE